MHARRPRWPWATICTLSVTAAFTIAQFFIAPLLPALKRTPTALQNHDWWRLFTPLLVHAGGWKQIAFNFSAIAIVGSVAERIYGWRMWLVLYFVAGVTGEVAGYAWHPSGAGASVAGAGLLGSLAVWFWRTRAIQARFGGVIILAGAIVLAAIRDIHGPPILMGALIATIWPMLAYRNEQFPHRTRERPHSADA